MTRQEIEQWQTIHEMMRGYRAAQILLTGHELDLFRQMALAVLDLIHGQAAASVGRDCGAGGLR